MLHELLTLRVNTKPWVQVDVCSIDLKQVIQVIIRNIKEEKAKVYVLMLTVIILGGNFNVKNVTTVRLTSCVFPSSVPTKCGAKSKASVANFDKANGIKSC